MAEWKPRRVASDEDRQRFSSDYISLDPGEKFTGYALFDGDPAKSEPGFYEYFEHWDTGGPNRRASSVPCAGDDCPLCEEGNRPRDVAKSMFYVLTDNNGTKIEQVRLFDLRPRLVKQIAALRIEGEKVKGRAFTIEKLDGDGNWSCIPKASIKPLTAAEVKEHTQGAPNFEGQLIQKIRSFMQGAGLQSALAETPDDGTSAPAAAKGGKGGKGGSAPAPAPAPAPAKGGKGVGKGGKVASLPAWPADGDEVTVTVTEVNVDGVNKIEVISDEYEGPAILWGHEKLDTSDTAPAAGVIVTASWGTDSDGDFLLTSLEGTAGADEPEEEAAATGFDPDNETEFSGLVKWDSQIGDINYVNVTTEDETTFAVYGIESVDLTVFSEGDWITLEAEKDTDGDWVASAAEATDTPADDAAPSGDLPALLEDVVVVVTDADLTQETLDVENDELGLSLKLWFLSDGPAGGDNVDLKDYPVGTKVTISAKKDRDGDMVATTVPEIVAAKGGKGGAAKGGAAKGGKGGKGRS